MLKSVRDKGILLKDRTEYWSQEREMSAGKKRSSLEQLNLAANALVWNLSSPGPKETQREGSYAHFLVSIVNTYSADTSTW